MSIETYNGSAVVGMVGDECVGIASDTKLGVQFSSIDKGFKRVFKVNNRTIYGLAGLATDVQTVKQKLDSEVALYKLNEHRDIKPSVFGSLLSGMLYARRFGPYFVSPIICGLEENKESGKFKPYLMGTDVIGASSLPRDFTVAGTSESSLYGAAETFWKPGMKEAELFETLSQTLLSAVDRDALTGWGAEVHILTPHSYYIKEIKVRSD